MPRPNTLASLALAPLLGLAVSLTPGVALAQQLSPVFLQDSQRATEALPRALELATSELYDESARVLDELIRTDGDLLLVSDEDEELLHAVRDRVHEAMLARPTLLSRYRELHEATARAILEAGAARRVEREYLLTSAGFDAALLIAADHVQHARFHSALRTLAQLDRHPDRRARAGESAEAMSLVWRYLDGLDALGETDPDARAMLLRWRADVGLGEDEPLPVEPPALPLRRSLFSDPGTLRIEGVLAQPLISREMGPPSRVVTSSSFANQDGIPPTGRVLPTAPVLVGDTVYTNTTDTIAAWNRFTGQLLWQTPIVAPIRLINRYVRTETILEEVATLCTGDGVLVALTGAPEVGAVPERLLVGLDPATGGERWRVALSESLDPKLVNATFRGPPVLVEGVVVVGAVDADTAKRTVVHHLVGIDASDGRTLWSRAVASVGARPYSQVRTPSEGVTPFGPDVVHVSSLGAVVRLEGATGRVRWVRRASPEDAGTRFATEGATWRFNIPVVTRERVFTLAPDRRAIFDLDAQTGVMIASSRANRWDDPHTLHLVGDTLVGISDRRIVMCPKDEIERARDIALIANIQGPDGTEIRGRTARAGTTLYVPITSGLVAIEVPQPDDRWLEGNSPSVEGTLIPLDNSGNPLLIDGQVIVADDTRLHTYFAWNVARELLIRREASAPADPSAPVTYAQLAYRAGETSDIAPALDRALEALARDPLREDFNALRRTLFDAVLGMARPDRDPSRLARLSPSLRRELLDRLEELGVTPEERVASLMTAGAYFQAINDAPRAVERYQRLLEDASLRSIPYETGGVRTSAEAEVSRRLINVVAVGGRRAYGAYDQLAQRRVDELGMNASVGELIEVARAFPVASVTPSLYLAVGELQAEQGEPRRAVDAFETGLRLILPGEQPALASELAGRAIVDAARSGRHAAARLRLRDVATLLPSGVITYNGRALDAGRLLEQIELMEQSAQRRPRLAQGFIREPDILPGLRVLKPIIRTGTSAPTDTVVIATADSDEFGVWGVDADGVLRERWGGLVGHDLLHLDDASLYTTTLDGTRAGRRIFHRLDAETGRERWSSVPFEDYWNPDINGGLTADIGDEARALEDPLELDESSRELIVCITERTMVLIERSGRAVALDLRSGQPLWARRLPMQRVLDADAGSGVVSALGLRRRTLEELGRARAEPPAIEERLAVLDVRTGETLHAPSLGDKGRWVRVTAGSTLLVGVEGAVLEFALRSGRVISEATIEDLVGARGVLIVPGRAYVLSPIGPLIGIDTTGGRINHTRVDTGDRIVGAATRFEGEMIGDLVYLASPVGFCALNAEHQLVTADTRPNGQITTVPAFSERSAIAIDLTGASTATPGIRSYALSVRDLETGRLVETPIRIPMRHAPDTLVLIDGHALIAAGASTVVMHAPPEEGLVRSDDPTFDLERVYADEPVPATSPSPEAEPALDPVSDDVPPMEPEEL